MMMQHWQRWRRCLWSFAETKDVPCLDVATALRLEDYEDDILPLDLVGSDSWLLVLMSTPLWLRVVEGRGGGDGGGGGLHGRGSFFVVAESNEKFIPVWIPDLRHDLPRVSCHFPLFVVEGEAG